MKGINLEKIKRMRKKSKVSLLDMTLLLGFKSPSTYLKYENGESEFHANHLPMLCQKFDCEVRDLFFEESFAELAKSTIDLESFVKSKLGEIGSEVIGRLREELKA